MPESSGDRRSDLGFEAADSDGFEDDGEVDDDFSENVDPLYLKYCFEDASTLAELATALRSLANDLAQRASEGWALVEPVNGGWAHLERAAAVEER